MKRKPGLLKRGQAAEAGETLKPTRVQIGEKAAQKPWEAAEGLEWEVPSPAPFHTFEEPPKLNASATKIVHGH